MPTTYDANRQEVNPEPKLTKSQMDYLLSPDGFAETILGINLYPKQREVLRAMQPAGSCVSYSANNSGGKTSRVVGALIPWHLWRYPQGKVIATSGASRQLEDQMVPSIQKHREKFPLWTWLDSGPITTPDKGFFRCFTTNQPGRAEGDHADEGAPLLYIVDECKSVPEWLRVTVEDRVQPTRILVCSSPGFAEGWFYETQTNPKSGYKRVKQTASDCPHIDPEWIKRIRLKWAGNPDVAASVLGEGFMGMVENSIIDFRSLNDCINNPPEWENNFECHAFCDFAWSGQDGDSNVLALRRGNRITIEDRFTAEGLEPVVDRFIQNFKRIGLRPKMISGDDGGGGHLVIDRLKDRGWPIHRVINNAAPKDKDHYVNASAEMWYSFANGVTRREFILPDDPEMRAQMVNRKRVMQASDRGRLRIESKKDMRERGVPSPDDADAVIGSATKPGSYSTEGSVTFIKAVGTPWESLGV